jgi:iron complex transport system ATP-binding protein
MPARDPRRVAYLPQGTRCTGGVTVEQVVAPGRIPHRDRAAASVTNAMEICGILHLRAACIDRLSGGEVRRAMLARAFATEPEVYLLDEPTADLDPAAAQAVMRLLRETAESGRCVVVVLHAIDPVLRYAHHSAVVAAERITADLAACEALPAVASAFGLPYGSDRSPWLLPPA